MVNDTEPRFVEVDRELLAAIATDSDRIPTLYYSRSPLVRRFFWMRLRLVYRMMRRNAASGTCLDFGGGGGVFLPTLSQMFDSVTCIDLEDVEARAVVEELGLDNVALVRADITQAELDGARFDAIVAADVLEHFADLEPAVDALVRWLAPGGLLYTSLPTESRWYELLRRVFSITKPADHYHRAADVEEYLLARGLRRVERRYVPLGVRVLPLYRITAWQGAPSVRARRA